MTWFWHFVSLFAAAAAQFSRTPQCDKSSCYPATGDLLIGREQCLFASSTCGLKRPTRYCIVSHLEDEKKCFYCDSRQHFNQQRSPSSHRIENIVSPFRNRKKRWWQAENGVEEAYIQLNLEAEFHLTHLIMTFKTFRPAAMLVERSYDFGKTWKVYRYFAYDCAKSYPGIPTGPIRDIQDVICESRYSDVAPSTEGEVIFRVLPPNIEIDNPYSEEVQDLLKMTNLRVNFTKLHTLGDDLLDNRGLIKEKYYYSMYDMVVRGSCSCYGHAARCVPETEADTDARSCSKAGHNVPYMNRDRREWDPFGTREQKVFGKCECTHHTTGRNCEKCENFYNDLPWRPARGLKTNACKKCNCNNHATRCYFDAAVYEETGRVSGGVCDECQHNTMGRHCESCKNGFFQDPARDLTDPYICQRCDCDPDGSKGNGECQGRTDPTEDLVAGRCVCKRYVTGKRCDRCLNGYWDMRPDNPEGCKECTCNQLGIIDDGGCDERTGECRCKRYVKGRNCDACYPEYYGLSDDINGCKPCDCDIGGAMNNDCDLINGNCECRKNIIGRRCANPGPGYFVPAQDHLKYEGEFGDSEPMRRVVVREPVPGEQPTWSGPGFMCMKQGEQLVFEVDDIPLDTQYDIVVRYELPRNTYRWDDIRMTVERDSPVNQVGACANHIPQDDYKAFSLNRGGNYYVVSPSSCLERGKTYRVKMEFPRFGGGRAADGCLLIDSIVMIPSVNHIPILAGGGVPERLRQEFVRNRCREAQLSARHEHLSDICKRLVFSISASVHGQALDCECDPTGSVSGVCESVGGQCECKPNVVGRRCDRCAPGTYDFGPQGCSACDCHSHGSRDNLCDVHTGQCTCLPNIFGRQCNECQKGAWGFPNCRPCQCNGLADECSNDVGYCLMCRDNTGGHYCERCADGYYGDARPGSQYGCRPCMCPGGLGSGFQHANSCALDTGRSQAICDCFTGYAGVNCDRCAENYHGNPRVPGGTCEPCDCNNNIDTLQPGGCRQDTGECIKCLYNTIGFHCDKCKPGFFGDATLQDCQAGPCDRETGQCPCLPNVVGLTCNTCKENYWKIAKGDGCEPCGCDAVGSTGPHCNEFSGECKCVAARGGRDCSECTSNHWGDPLVECKTCDCNPDGSSEMQCDRRTGKCTCLPGIDGHKCDRCARGTTGKLPYCVPCPECFDNWDAIISDLKNQTQELVDRGSDIKVSGAPGAFEKEFKDMETKLNEIKKLVYGDVIDNSDLDDLQSKLKSIRENLTKSDGELNEINDDLKNTTSRVETANNRIAAIKDRVDQLKKQAEKLKEEATNIKEEDVEGAYNSTLDSYRRSQEAQDQVDRTSGIVRQSQSLREKVDDLIDNGQDTFNKEFEDNEIKLRELDQVAKEQDGKITGLNEKVCDGHGDPCDSLCGGAGCGKCGGLSCDNGAVSRADNALKYSKEASETLKDKEKDAKEMLEKLKEAKVNADEAKIAAEDAHTKAVAAKNESGSTVADINDLIKSIERFLTEKAADPADIRSVADQVLKMSISLTPAQIHDLASKINDTIRGLTAIDSILRETANDLQKSHTLKDRAAKAQTEAEQHAKTAEAINELLTAAANARQKADQALVEAEGDIKDARSDLDEIEDETRNTESESTKTLEKVKNIKEKLGHLKQSYRENKDNVAKAQEAAKRAEELADQAEKEADTLEKKYDEARDKLDKKVSETKNAKERADSLRDRAADLYKSTYDKVTQLSGLGKEFEDNEQKLTSLADEIKTLNDRMTGYLKDIKKVAQFHRTCVQ